MAKLTFNPTTGKFDLVSTTSDFNDDYYPSSLGKAVADFSSNAYLLFPASANTNRSLIDSISSNLDARIDALAGSAEVTFNTLTASTGLTPFSAEVSISGSEAETLEVLGYTTISTNALESRQWFKDSGVKYSDTYSWYSASANQFSNILTSAQKYTDIYLSGTKYTSAYKSSQLLQEHAFDLNVSGQYIKDYIASSTSLSIFANSSSYSTHKSDTTIHYVETDIDHTNIQNIGTNTHDQIDDQLVSLFSASSSLDSRIDTLESQDEFDHDLYITSANSIIRFPDSSNIYNKSWIDSLSGSIDSRIDALAGATAVTFNTLTASTGLSPFSVEVSISGSDAQTLSVLGYTTISTNALLGKTISESGTKYSEFLSSGENYTSIYLSGTKYSETYNWYNTSSDAINAIIGSGNEYSDIYSWFNASSSVFDGIKDSGTKYSDVYTWFNTSSNQFGNSLISSSKYTDIYLSGEKYTSIYLSGTKYTSAYLSGQQSQNKEEALGLYYPSTLGNALASVAESGTKYSEVYNWFNTSSAAFQAILASGNEYSDIYNWFNASSAILDGLVDSGTKYSDIYTWYNASSNLFDAILDSGTKYSETYNWYNTSSSLFNSILGSGNEYSDIYNWFNTSSAQFSNWLASGEKLSRWFFESSSKLGELGSSGTKYSQAYASAQIALYINGNYSLTSISAQTISGGTITTNNLILYGNTISGLVVPAYPSAAASKYYVDTTFHVSSVQLNNWLLSGEKLSRWFSESSSKLGDIGLSGIKYTQSYASANALRKLAFTAVSNWASDDWHNSSLVWDNDILSWKVKKSGSAGGITNLSELTIDDDKDWESKGIYNLGSISSSTVSGGTIRFNLFAGGTNATSAEIEELTNGSATTLHTHTGLSAAPGGGMTANIGSNFEFGISGITFLSSQIISGGRFVGVAISSAKDILSWDSANYDNSSLTWDNTNQVWKAKKSGAAAGGGSIDTLTDVTLTSIQSGQFLQYGVDSKWNNRSPPITFNIASVYLQSSQSLTLTKFTCPPTKRVYLWQALCVNSGNTYVSGLSIQLRSGSVSVYRTDSEEFKEGYPLAVTDGGLTEIRIMYSGGLETNFGKSGSQYATGFMNISIW